MVRKDLLWLGGLLLLIGLAALPGCGSEFTVAGRSIAVPSFGASAAAGSQREAVSLQRGAARSVRAEVEATTADLTINSGSPNLLDAEFIYNVAKWQPEVAYEVLAGEGRLTVRQPDGSLYGPTPRDTRNEWSLRFATDVPLDLRVKSGVGNSDLYLGGLNLERVAVEMGVGDLHLDLTGGWRQDVSIDLRGGIGKATVRLPRDVGVRVEARSGLGDIHTAGLTKQGDFYVNEAYGRSPATLYISVRSGIGKIWLVQE
jgi:hypothetical protein